MTKEHNHKADHKHDAKGENEAETQTQKAPSAAYKAHKDAESAVPNDGANAETAHKAHGKHGLVKMKKDDDVLHVHPDMVVKHEEAGWTPDEE